MTDVLGSPLITMLLNIVAGALVSKGILDGNTANAFIQLAKDGISATLTLGIAIYSMYKMVDLHKHKLTTSMSVTTPSGTATQSTSQPAHAVSIQTPVPQAVQPAPAAPVTPLSMAGVTDGVQAVSDSIL